VHNSIRCRIRYVCARQTDRHTYTLIAIIRTLWGKVTNNEHISFPNKVMNLAINLTDGKNFYLYGWIGIIMGEMVFRGAKQLPQHWRQTNKRILGRFTKYLTTILRLFCDNAKVTIDLRRTYNLSNILRRTQG